MSPFFSKKDVIALYPFEKGLISVLISRSGSLPNILNSDVQSIADDVFNEEGEVTRPEVLWQFVATSLVSLGVANHGPVAQNVPDTIELSAFDVVLVLPDVFSYYAPLALPHVDDQRKIGDAPIAEIIEREFPVQKDEIIFDYVIYPQKTGAGELVDSPTRGAVIAAPKSALLSWQKFFSDHGIRVASFVPDISAVVSGVQANFEQSAEVCVIDLMINSTVISFMRDRTCIFSYYMPFGFRNLQDEVAKHMEGDALAAQKALLLSGLADMEAQHTMYVTEALTGLFSKLRELLEFAATDMGHKSDLVVLASFAAVIPGLDKYFEVNFNMTFQGMFAPMWPESKRNPLESALGIHAVGGALAYIQIPNRSLPVIRPERLLSNTSRSRLSSLFSEPVKVAAVSELSVMEKGGALSAPPTDDDIPTPPPSSQLAWKRYKGIIKLMGDKRMLMLITAIILLVFGLAVIVRYFYNASKPKSLVSVSAQYPYSTTIPLEMAIAVDPAQYTQDRTRGRILRVSIVPESQHLFTIKKAIADAQNLVLPEEVLWDVPVQSPKTQENPARFEFLAYNQKELESFAQIEIARIFGDPALFSISGSQLRQIIPTEGPGVFVATVDVVVVSKIIIPSASSSVIPSGTPPDGATKVENPASGSASLSPPPAPAVLASDSVSYESDKLERDIASYHHPVPTSSVPTFLSAQIISKEGSFVNVRSAPDVASELVGRLDVGQEVALVSEDGEWANISFRSIRGWVKSRFLGLR